MMTGIFFKILEQKQRREKQRKTRRTDVMGLTKMHKTVIMPDNASTRGMIQKVGYMLKVEEA